jgi:hypothetical protein
MLIFTACRQLFEIIKKIFPLSPLPTLEALIVGNAKDAVSKEGL